MVLLFLGQVSRVQSPQGQLARDPTNNMPLVPLDGQLSHLDPQEVQEIGPKATKQALWVLLVQSHANERAHATRCALHHTSPRRALLI